MNEREDRSSYPEHGVEQDEDALQTAVDFTHGDEEIQQPERIV